MVQRTPNAIGYVDFAQARRLNLSYALIGNAHGAFVPPGPDSFQAAAAHAAWQAGQISTWKRPMRRPPIGS